MQQATSDYIEKIKVRKIDKVITYIKLLNSKIKKLDKKLDIANIKYYSIEIYKKCKIY